MKGSRLLLAVTTLAGLFFAPAAPVEAGFHLRVEDTGSCDGVVTEGAANVMHPSSNVVMYSGAVGTFIISIQADLASPGVPLTGLCDALDLDAVVATTSPDGGTLRLPLGKDGLTGSPDGGLAMEGRVGAAMSAQTGAEATFQSWGNGYNLMPNLGPYTGPPASRQGGGGGSGGGGGGGGGGMPLGGGTSAFAGPGLTPTNTGAFGTSQSATFTKSGPYSLFSGPTGSTTGLAPVPLDHTTGTNPAPAGLALLAAGVPFLAYGCWRRKRGAA